ncbi:MAG: DUF302 domain-containing protein [Thioalkalivibrio sp.]|nr:MAG: DUF302 domain-containing protein [Thioalkalivibrio sp.]
MTGKLTVAAIGGFILGILAMSLVTFTGAPELMVVEDESAHGFDETIEAIETSAEDAGWEVPNVQMLHEPVRAEGYEVDRAAVIELCQPHHAAEILADDRARVVTSMMPCRIAVYETSDDRIIVSRMNTAMIAEMFGGTVAEVMADATEEVEGVLATVLQE